MRCGHSSSVGQLIGASVAWQTPRPFLTLIAFSVLLPSLMVNNAWGQRAELLKADQQLLQSVGINAEPTRLLDFLSIRTLNITDQNRIQNLLKQLESSDAKVREKAADELVQMGNSALPVLQKINKDGPVSLRERVKICMDQIEKQANPEIESAVVRVLTELAPSGSTSVLLDYYPFAKEDYVKETILTGLARLAVKDGKTDTTIMESLKSQYPTNRAVAAHVLGRRGEIQHRPLVRACLVDSDNLVRDMASSGLVGKQLLKHIKDNASPDRELLQSNQVIATESGIRDYLRKLSLNATELDKIKQLIKQTGDLSYRNREKATMELRAFGSPALPFLRDALENPDPEIARRSSLIIDAIEGGPGPALPAAAIRVLVDLSSAESASLATKSLLEYAPFAEEEMVEDEILNALCLLNLRQELVDPALANAVFASEKNIRALAARALGKIGTAKEIAPLAKLLSDDQAVVRLAAAQGLLSAQDIRAVPVLIGLLDELPSDRIWHVEETLFRLAGTDAPTVTVGQGDKKARTAALKAWANWWKKQKDQVNLVSLGTGQQTLGLITICEYDSAGFRAGGRVWECGRDGKMRWEIKDLQGPMDAQVLPNGRVLIAENSANRVTERDLNGKILWEYRPTSNPIACQRLPNGNTFVATYNHVMEVTPNKTVVYSHQRGPAFYIFSARKTRNGRIVCMTAQGALIELDAATGKELRNISLGAGGWCGVDPLPNGRYLVAQMAQNSVREIDSTGKSHWQCTYQGVFRATRLPTGNVLATSMTTRKVAEFDRSGNLRREIDCEGRPWMVQYR